MKKCLLTMLIGLLCGALHAADIDYTHMKPLKLTVPEMMAYTGWGENTVRNELNHPKCSYVVRMGKRVYANRKLLEKYLDSISGK